MPKYRKMLSGSIPAANEMMALLSTQSKATICKWALDYAGRVILPIWMKHYPDDVRPQAALAAARTWLAGGIKLPEAKAQILGCHEAARENDANPVAQTAARAVGQAAATIHAPTHSIGVALYGALCVAYDEMGIGAPWPQLETRAALECERMLFALQAVAVENEANPAKINWYC